MMPDDAPLKEDVRHRLAGGVTSEMASAARSRFKLLQGIVLLGLVLNLVSVLGRRDSSTWVVIASTLAVLVSAALMVRGYRRLVPRAGHDPTEDELAVVASGSRRCGRCKSVMLPAEDECPHCGALSYPRLTLAFGIAFGLGMTLLALWRAGLFGE